jgi:hypothetical protein
MVWVRPASVDNAGRKFVRTISGWGTFSLFIFCLILLIFSAAMIVLPIVANPKPATSDINVLEVVNFSLTLLFFLPLFAICLAVLLSIIYLSLIDTIGAIKHNTK